MNSSPPSCPPHVSHLVKLLRVWSGDEEKEVVADLSHGGLAVTKLLGDVVHVGGAWEELAHAQQGGDGLAWREERSGFML